jgi:TolB-like protein
MNAPSSALPPRGRLRLVGLRARLAGALLAGAALAPAAPARADDPPPRLASKPDAWLLKKLPSAKDAASRAEIVAAMGHKRSPALLAQLVHAAGDPAREVRVAALRGLAAYGPQLADPQRDGAYLLGLQDASPEVVQVAREALAARVQAAAQPGMDALGRELARLGRRGDAWLTRKAAVELIERLPPELGPGVDPALLEAAQLDASAEVRRAAALALGARQVGAARPLLSRLRSKDPDEQVRLAAEDALRRLGGTAVEVVVAVLPFETRAAQLKPLLIDLQDTFTSALAAAEVAQVVERRQVSAVIAELRYQDAHIDDGKALKVGQQLRAQEVVTGSLLLQGDEVTCLAKRVHVETGRVTAAPPTLGALHDLTALQRDCARRLIGSF